MVGRLIRLGLLLTILEGAPLLVFLCIFSQGPAGGGHYSAEEIDEFGKQFASGDLEVFSRC